jgi:hypothetical protein
MKLAGWNWIKRWITPGRAPEPTLSRVVLTEKTTPSPQEAALRKETIPREPIRPALSLDREIDFTRTEDLENYTEHLDVPVELIERWISAGILYPDELRIAEKMMRILRKKDVSRAA